MTRSGCGARAVSHWWCSDRRAWIEDRSRAHCARPTRVPRSFERCIISDSQDSSHARRPNMLCYGAKDLARSYRTVRGNTLKIAEEIPEAKLDFAPAPGTRT